MSVKKSSPALPSVLQKAHRVVERVLRHGDVAVDATVGNGRDTVALARSVGRDGRVVGFDVQEAALRRARKRLRENELADRVALVRRGHEAMRDELAERGHRRIRAAAFNLGYLPGGDHAVITRPETTVPALDAAATMLEEGGLITVVCYAGHAGGAEETRAVSEWTEQLSQERFHALSYCFVNQKNDPPRLFVVEKLK